MKKLIKLNHTAEYQEMARKALEELPDIFTPREFDEHFWKYHKKIYTGTKRDHTTPTDVLRSLRFLSVLSKEKGSVKYTKTHLFEAGDFIKSTWCDVFNIHNGRICLTAKAKRARKQAAESYEEAKRILMKFDLQIANLKQERDEFERRYVL